LKNYLVKVAWVPNNVHFYISIHQSTKDSPSKIRTTFNKIAFGQFSGFVMIITLTKCESAG